MVRDIKEQVLTELERGGSKSGGTYGRGYRAYCQLVDAVREEVLYDLKKTKRTAAMVNSGSSSRAPKWNR